MGILQAPTPLAAQVGLAPTTKKMVTTDDLATVTSAGYLTAGNLEGYTVNTNDIIEMFYLYNPQTNVGLYANFSVSISNNVITLSEIVPPSAVTLPVTVGDFVKVSNVDGQLIDANQRASNASNAFIVTSAGTTSANTVPIYSDGNGSLGISGINYTTIALSTVTSPDPQSDLIYHDIVCSAINLKSAGKVNVVNAALGKQYIVRDIRVNLSTGLSGGGGDRLLVLTDGTVIFNNAGITSGVLESPVNTLWGGVGNPITGGTVTFNQASVVGDSIYFQYSGGTTDYDTGSVSLTVLVQRVA